jgi:L-serine/L-threonine ammonia-lyase
MTQRLPLHYRTPVLEYYPESQHQHNLSYQIAPNFLLKMEAYQPTGSFKIRGIGALCQKKYEEGCSEFISSSGGNAGFSTAYAGRRLGVKVKVVMPETASHSARQKILNEGAHLIIHGRSFADCHEYCMNTMTADQAYIHPFDNSLVWTGHSSMIDEIVSDVNAGVIAMPDLIVLSVGGGGLFNGIVEGLERHGISTIPIVAVETEGAASFYESYTQKKLVRLEKIETIATTLGAKQISEKALINSLAMSIFPLKVTDKLCVQSCITFLNDLKTLVEPACGAALSVAHTFHEHRELHVFKNILIIVCGGISVDFGLLKKWENEFGLI